MSIVEDDVKIFVHNDNGAELKKNSLSARKKNLRALVEVIKDTFAFLADIDAGCLKSKTTEPEICKAQGVCLLVCSSV